MPEKSKPDRTAPRNPFTIGHHAEGKAFADRKTEVARISAAFRDPASRLLVYGDRRLGKSSAVLAAAARVRGEGGEVVVVDLAQATGPAPAAQRILSAVHREIGGRWKDIALRAASRLKGAFSVTPGIDLAGNTTLAFSFTPGPGADHSEVDAGIFFATLDAVEAELKERKLTIGLGLDEFQRLRKWTDRDIDWQLKEMLEGHRHIAYVLAGSERALVEQMLANRKAGLWKVVETLSMGPIDPALMSRWISDRAATTGVSIDVVVAASIVRLTGPRTRDVVQLARAVWDLRGSAVKETVTRAFDALVDEQAPLHRRSWELLTDGQRRTLMVVAAEPAARLTSSATLERYRLGPKSTVQRGAAELVAEEILVRRADEGYEFDDPFFKRWIQRNVIEDINRTAPPLSE